MLDYYFKWTERPDCFLVPDPQIGSRAGEGVAYIGGRPRHLGVFKRETDASAAFETARRCHRTQKRIATRLLKKSTIQTQHTLLGENNGNQPAGSEGKPSVTLPGTVDKVIKPPHPSLPEKAQIEIEGADDLYREIRIENGLTDANGNESRVKGRCGSRSHGGSGTGSHNRKDLIRTIHHWPFCFLIRSGWKGRRRSLTSAEIAPCRSRRHRVESQFFPKPGFRLLPARAQAILQYRMFRMGLC